MTNNKRFIKSINEFSRNSELIEVTTGRYLYHTSNPIFREKISKNGLIPKGKSETWLSDTNIEGDVIFAINSDDKKDTWDSTYDDDIYIIDTKGLNNKWYKDPNFVSGIYSNTKSNAVITFEPIPKESIELVYKGTGS